MLRVEKLFLENQASSQEHLWKIILAIIIIINDGNTSSFRFFSLIL